MTTSLISFDVGIKNLAYCIFEISGNCISIVDWTLANLTEESNNNSPKSQTECTCNHMLKSKQMKMCEREAKYKFYVNYNPEIDTSTKGVFFNFEINKLISFKEFINIQSSN